MKFHIHTKDTAPDASRNILEVIAKKYGFVPNLFGVLAESPTAVQAYAATNTALELSALSPVEQQVVALTVSATNDCTYCVGAHSAIAQMVHMPKTTLAELREQRPLTDRKLEALRTLTLSILSRRGWVSEDELEHVVAAGYTQRHVLDVLTIVSLKIFSNYVNHIAHTPLDVHFAAQAWKTA